MVSGASAVAERATRCRYKGTMDLRGYVAVLGRRWWVLLTVFVVVAGGLVAGLSVIVPDRYEATAELAFVPRLEPDASGQDRADAIAYINARMNTYATAVVSDDVLDPVVNAETVPEGADTLAAEMLVIIPSGTTTLQITAPSTTAQGAADVANAVAGRLARVLPELERGAAVDAAPVAAILSQQATAPGERTSPNSVLNAIVAVIVALFIAVAIAVLVDRLDTRVRRGKDVAREGAPYLGGIEQVRQCSHRDLVVFGRGTEAAKAAYARIAADLVRASGSGVTGLLFTSTRPAAGKTVVAANVAAALAADGRRVAYIDTDLRGGRLAAAVGIPQSRGITDIVAGRIELDEALFDWREGQFTIIPCGAAAIDVSEMLAGERFAETLEVLDDLFDVVIVDAPPMSVAADAARFTRHITSVVAVAPAGGVRKVELSRMQDAITRAGADLRGVVLTQVSGREATASAQAAGADADAAQD